MNRRPPRSTLFPYPTLSRAQAGLRTAISDRLVDEYCLVGPPARCREQLAAWDGTDVATVAVVPHPVWPRSEEPTSELQSRQYLVCRLLLEKKKYTMHHMSTS